MTNDGRLVSGYFVARPARETSKALTTTSTSTSTARAATLAKMNGLIAAVASTIDAATEDRVDSLWLGSKERL